MKGGVTPGNVCLGMFDCKSLDHVVKFLANIKLELAKMKIAIQVVDAGVTPCNGEKSCRSRCRKQNSTLVSETTAETCLAMILVIARYVTLCNGSCNLFRNGHYAV